MNYGVTEHTDLITACFCGPCVSCRLAREVKNRAEMGQEPVDVVGQMQAMGGVMAPGGCPMRVKDMENTGHEEAIIFLELAPR